MKMLIKHYFFGAKRTTTIAVIKSPTAA